VFSALSLLHEGNLDLNEYRPAVEAHRYYAIECVGPNGEHLLLQHQPPEVQSGCAGSLRHYYPLAVPVITAPILWAVETVAVPAHPLLDALEPYAGSRAPLIRALASRDLESIVIFVELGAACLFIALATVLVYFMCREDLTPSWATALAVVFAFATSAWSIGSRALWQHTLSMPLLAVSLWLLSAARRRPWLAAWAGLPLMTAFWVRPTNIVSLGIFSLYVLAFYRKQFAAFLAAMIPPALLFGAITFSIYGSPIAPFASAGRAAGQLKVHDEFWLAIAGNLWSPARGLFVFMPFVLLIPFAWPGFSAGKARQWLHCAALAVIPAHTILISCFVEWWGGHCFGPRYMSDLCPLYVFLAIPLILKISEGNRGYAATLLVLVAYGVFVHSRGAHEPAVLNWNTLPVDVENAEWRIWDWSDLSFLRGLRR
jgi:hypothetical protein